MSWEYLREKWLREPFADVAEGDDKWEEFLGLQWELMNPFDLHVIDFSKDPNIDEFIKMMYKPAISYLGLRAALWVTGEAYLGFWARQAWIWESRKAVARAAISYAPQAAVVAVPVALSLAGAIGYERTVNALVRRSTPGSEGQWYGPFASGFGTVV